MKQPHQKQTQNAIAPSQPQTNIVRPSLHPIEEVQNAIGNRGVNLLLASQSMPSQPKSPAKPLFRGLSRELTLQREEESVSAEGAKPIISTVQRSPLPPPQLPQHSATATPSTTEGDGVIQAKGETAGDRRGSSVEQRPNKTGMPDDLKAGVESLSGYSLNNVRVHYNSPKPTQLQALAYTQGTEIHVAPGKEEHLPHEVWHVVQQMQGRVKPTMQMKGVQINDDEGLEREADVMGVKAKQSPKRPHQKLGFEKVVPQSSPTVQAMGWDEIWSMAKEFSLPWKLVGAAVTVVGLSTLYWLLKNSKSKEEALSKVTKSIGKELDEAQPYDYVFIGAGAATAYYIQENQKELQKKRVLVIGSDQPWAGERGPGKINHPMPQIVPDRPPEKGAGLADRSGVSSFTEWVNTVLKDVERRFEKVAEKPKLSDDGYYLLSFENKDKSLIKAKNVILAIGIGPHDKPKGYGKIADNNKSLPKEADNITLPRVMSLDEFQVSVDKVKTAFKRIKDRKPVMILVGPNAGIDAVTTYARELTGYAHLKWMAKKLNEIPFLKGTDNAKGKEQAEKLGDNLITGRFESVEIKDDKVIAKTTEGEPVEGDLLVYALGPEKDFLDKFLPEGQEAKGLEPIYDRSNRISSAHNRVDSGHKLDQEGSIKDRIKNWASNKLKTQFKTQYPKMAEEELNKKVNEELEKLNQEKIDELIKMYENLTKKDGKSKEKAPDFGREKLPENSMEVSVVGLQVPKKKADDPSFQILGGSAYRLASKVDYKYHSQSISRIIDAAGENDEDANKILNKVKEIETKGNEEFTKLIADRKSQSSEKISKAQMQLASLLEELDNLCSSLKLKISSKDNDKLKALSPIPRYVMSLTNSINAFDGKINPLKADTHINEIASTHPINVALGDQLTSVLSQVDVASEQTSTIKPLGDASEQKPPIKQLGDSYLNTEEYQKAKKQFGEQRNLIINDATTIAIFIASEYPDIPSVITNGIVRQIIWDRRYGAKAEKAVPAYDIEKDGADTTPQYSFQVEWKEQLTKLNELSKAIFQQ